MIRVLLADDHTIVREGLRALLAREADIQVVADAGDGREVHRLSKETKPDIVALDLSMPPLNGLEATRRLKARWPNLAVIIITVHDDEVYRRTALAAGAAAFLVKKTLGVDLWPTLLRVAGRGQEQPI